MEKEARAGLRRLKQIGSVYDYINEFTTLMIKINDMSDKDSLFYFQDSLKLNRCGAQTLDDAIAIAESLTECSTQSKDKRSNLDKCGGESQKDKGNNRKDWGQKNPPRNKSGQGKSENKKEPLKPRSL